MKNKKRNKYVKVISLVVLILVITFLLLLSLLQLSSIQTSLGQLFTSNLSQKTGFSIKIEKIKIQWFDNIMLKDVSIYDLSTNELITAKTLTIDYRINSLFNEKDIILDKVTLNQPKLNLILSDSSALNINEFIKTIRNSFSSNKSNKAKPFKINELEILNGVFSYNHLSKPFQKFGFDYNHFGLDSINTYSRNLLVVADTFELTVDILNGIEKSTQLPINSLSCDYRISKSKMEFNNLNTIIGNSIIKDTLQLMYNNIDDLNQFIDSVMINGHFNQLKIATQDLKYFAPYFINIYDTLLFRGNINGYINDFRTTNFDLQFGNNSRLHGSGYFEGLPNVLNTFIDVKFRQSNIYKKDIEAYIPSEAFKKYSLIDSAVVDGSFTGYPKDFVAKATFNTSIGTAQTDLNLKIPEDPSKATYSGSIKLIDFDLDKVISSNQVLGKTTLNGKIKGSGLTSSNADFKLNSHINHIKLYQYSYQNIETNAHFAKGLFDGTLKVNDPNLVFEIMGKVDIRNNRNIISLNGELKKAYLDSLQFTNTNSSIAAKIDINVKGIQLDSIEGAIKITNLKATNNEKNYSADELIINSSRNKGNRLLTINSERINLKIQGDFNFSSAYKDINNIWAEYKTNFLNQDVDISAFNKEKLTYKFTSNLTFDLIISNINPIVNFFDPLIYLSKNTLISGQLNSGNSNEFEVNFNTDTLIYNHNILINNKLKLNGATNNIIKDLKANFKFESQEQILRNGAKFDNLLLSALWSNDSIDFKVNIQQKHQNNINHIIGRVLFGNDTTYLTFLPSTVQILDNNWLVQSDNKIMFLKDKIEITNMRIYSDKQELSASGIIGKNGNEPIEIIAHNINMSILNPILPNKLDGELNGIINLTHIYTSPLIASNLRIDNFKVDGFIFGNIEGKSSWNNKKELFDINLFVEREKLKYAEITGSYKPLGYEKALNLTVKLLETDLQVAEPFTKGLFSNLKGSISGNINITGALLEPKFIGSGDIKNGYLKINYLNTGYNTSGNWKFDLNSIELSNIQLTDHSIGKGILDVKFKHSNFKNFNIDLSASFNNLLTLNTEEKDNNLYYGTAIGTGELSIKGPLNNIVISAKANTEKGTRFFIPLSDNGSEINQEEYISFTNFTQNKEKTIVESNINNFKLNGITFNLDLEITPDAYSEIIFDKTAGDIIRGIGKGNLGLSIDTKGAFTMFGEYEFLEGGYNFTMYNIVNKEFEINPKSKIVWSGDPYLGKMDINAIYKVNTSIAPIMDIIYHTMPEVNRIYPSKVLLNLDGPLLAPDIDFDINIEDYPKSNVNIDTEVRAFLNKIKNDEQEMNRQVFSLLVLRKFSPPNSFSTSGTLGSSVSEFISNQLSYWISQVDENLTIDIDLGSLDKEALQTFQLRVSYSFLNGKLVVTRDGGFTDQNNQATLSSITGDWTVEYLLSKDGKLRVKLFKQTNYDQLNSSSGAGEDLISGGFSLLYTTSFDNVITLFNKNKNQSEPIKTNKLKSSEALKPEEE